MSTRAPSAPGGQARRRPASAPRTPSIPPWASPTCVARETRRSGPAHRGRSRAVRGRRRRGSGHAAEPTGRRQCARALPRAGPGARRSCVTHAATRSSPDMRPSCRLLDRPREAHGLDAAEESQAGRPPLHEHCQRRLRLGLVVAPLDRPALRVDALEGAAAVEDARTRAYRSPRPPRRASGRRSPRATTPSVPGARARVRGRDRRAWPRGSRAVAPARGKRRRGRRPDRE